MKMGSKQIWNSISSRLSPYWGKDEAESMAFWFLENRAMLNRSQILTDTPIEWEDSKHEALLLDLMGGKPIQYVLGEAWFFGRVFRLNPSVLIPRPETEELVYKILQTEGPEFSGKVLDVGTGSGCIPISLALELPGASVFAIDICPNALQCAAQNADNLGAKVEFRQIDFLQDLPDFGPFDVLVSNPPYIPHSEKESLAKHVKDHEPALALFVNDPFIFYQKIADTASIILNDGARIYLEIHDSSGEGILNRLKSAGFSHLALHFDINQKPRMITGTWQKK
jgi:release factor glutamine methyltransferase